MIFILKMEKVYVETGKDEIKTTIRILEKANPQIGKSVLIKPNITMPYAPELGICTSPKVVEGIIIYLRKTGIEDIVIGEGAGGAKDMNNYFKVSNYRELSERLNVPLINLNQDKAVILHGNYLKKIPVAKTAIDRFVINVPKMKTHRMAIVSCAMKNMMGTILPYNGKMIMHPLYEKYVKMALKEKRAFTENELEETRKEFFSNLKDFYSVLKPQLNIADAFLAREGDGLTPNSGKTINMNCVLLSESAPALDYIASSLMGLSDLFSPYLNKYRLESTKIISDKPIDKLKKKFKLIPLTKELIIFR